MYGLEHARRRWFVGSDKDFMALIGPCSGLLVPQFTPRHELVDTSNKLMMEDWKSQAYFARYSGMWDLDIPESQIKLIVAGTVSLVRGETPCQYSNPAAVKEALADHYRRLKKEAPTMSIRQLIATIPAIDRMCTLALEMAEVLHDAVVMFSGNKGFHVFCRERSLFAIVKSEERFDEPMCQLSTNLLRSRRSNWTHAFTAEDFDISIHRRNAGVAMRAWEQRKSTGMWPQLIYGNGADEHQKAFLQVAPQNLQAAISEWVSWIRRACPTINTTSMQLATTTKIRKRTSSKADRVPDAPLVTKACMNWMRRHELTPIWDQEDKKLNDTIELTISLQTTRYPNREFSPAPDTLERILAELGPRYLQFLRCTDNVQSKALWDAMVPLNESHKVLPSYRFALDIDGVHLELCHFSRLRDVCTRLCGESGRRMIVLGSTLQEAKGSKWHITFPDLILQKGRQATLAILLRAELKTCAEFETVDIGALIDEGPWTGYLRTPCSPKPGPAGMLPGCYRPDFIYDDSTASEPVTTCGAEWYAQVTDSDFSALVRRACVIPGTEQTMVSVARIEAAVREAVAATNKRKQQEADDRLQRSKKFKQSTFSRSFAGSPRARSVTVAAELDVLSDDYCKAAVRAYLNHPRTLPTAEQADIPDSELKISRKSDDCCLILKTGSKWKICECVGREHGANGNVNWLVALSQSGGFPRVSQFCQSAKCKGLPWKERADRAPTYDIVQLGVTCELRDGM